MYRFKIAVAALLFIVGFHSASHAQTIHKKTLTLDGAKKVIAARGC
jgi:hypothetical protein